MSQRVLEIGAGDNPAICFPGTEISDHDTEYVAVDMRPAELGYRTTPARHGTTEQVTTVYADAAALPFEDETFKHVIQRSVFGEYTMEPRYTGSSIHNTHLGLYEAFRVLQTGGRIAIAEENTPEAPATPAQICNTLLKAGFASIRVFPCQDMKNPHWREARKKYWDFQDVEPGTCWAPGIPLDPTWGYLITAEKPDAELEIFEAEMVIAGLKSVRFADNKKWHTANKKSTRAKGSDGSPPSFNEVQIIPGNGEAIGLGDYYDRAASNSSSRLFL